MKAIVCTGKGGMETLSEQTLPEPELREFDILVELKAAALNPVDGKNREHALSGEQARVLGYDGCGLVKKVGSSVTTLNVGDEVMFSGDITRNGTFAEMVAVDARICAVKPKSLDPVSAASLPLVSITTWELLFENFRLPTDGSGKDLVFMMLNGAGGVGSTAIQLAKHVLGCEVVVATASRPETEEWCRSAAGVGSVPVQMLRNLEACETQAQKQFKLPPGTYDLYDRFGKIERPEDLQRALDMAGAGECNIEVREHRHYTQLRSLDKVNRGQDARMDVIEASIKHAEVKAETALMEQSSELRDYIEKVERKILDELVPVIEELCRDRTQMQKDLRKAQEKLRQINVRELHEMKQEFFALKEQVTAAVKRVDRIDVMWTTEKTRIEEDLSRNNAELKELQRYMQGRIDVCVEADADLARTHQVLEQRVKLLADDLALFRDDTQELTEVAGVARGKHQELSEFLDQVKEHNDEILRDCGNFKTRIRCMEVAGMEEWPGFMPGVIFYNKWSRLVKGEDVKLSSDLLLATGRGNLAATGVLVTALEGLAVANGPCKRFGRPGFWASYFEVELEEIAPAPAGSGGIYLGLSLQSAQEIEAHPRNEFDGWLIGGPLKAIVCRYGNAGVEEPDPEFIPATWAPGMEASETAFNTVRENAQLLRESIEHRPKCEVRLTEGQWKSESLDISDRVGILFRPMPVGGAKLKVCVNDRVVATHDFSVEDCPPADAVGHLTPVVRLSGTGKSARILHDAKPAPEVLDP